MTTSKQELKKPVVLLYYDVWDENGVHHERGEKVELDVELAKRLLKEKKAERADPLPGE